MTTCRVQSRRTPATPRVTLWSNNFPAKMTIEYSGGIPAFSWMYSWSSETDELGCMFWTESVLPDGRRTKNGTEREFSPPVVGAVVRC